MLHDHEPVLLRYLKESGYRVWMNQRNDLLPAQYPKYHEKYCTDFFRLPEKPESLPDEDWRGERAGDNFTPSTGGKFSGRKI